jgi:AcrR family transcriptional regulator
MADVKNSFLDRARYAKGRKTLQAILDATYELIISDGPTAASQQAIADRAKVTQSAVRHYFKTKEDLLEAFFITAIERWKVVLSDKLAETGRDPRERLLEWTEIHFDNLRRVDAVFYFEISAFSQRNAALGAAREEWFQTLLQFIQQLLGEMHPQWDVQQCHDTSLQALTLVLGSWFTAGSARPACVQRSREELAALLRRGVERLIDG